MNVKQTIKKVLPAPVKAWLRPYKMKLDRLRTPARLRARTHMGPNAELVCKMRAFSKKYGDRYLHAMLERGWSHPGHMFDEIGEIFSINNKLFLVGTQNDVERLTGRLRFIGVEMESLTLPDPRKVDIDYIASRTACGYTVIIGYEDAHLANIVSNEICKSGAHFNNVNLFLEGIFLGELVCHQNIYCGIYSVYTAGKVYMTHNNILCTIVCNLNCKNCLNYTPYIKNAKHFPISELKTSIDTYFNNIDKVGLFQISGGEPLLYPNLKELLEYILSNYREKIYIINLVTNGTIVPSNDFIEFCKKNNVFIYLDDYTDAVPRIKETFEAVSNKLIESKIKYIPLKADKFMITFPPLRRNLKMSESELKRKYLKCRIGVQNLRDGKLCSCTYHAFAENAELINTMDDSWFDMNQMSNNILDKKKLIEFRIGFTTKGYVGWCKYCNGHLAINKLSGPAGEQAKGRLNWDINAPTFLD